MLSKYGIEMQEKGCVTSPSEEAYAHVYNALMEEAIFRKHGRSFEELFRTRLAGDHERWSEHDASARGHGRHARR